MKRGTDLLADLKAVDAGLEDQVDDFLFRERLARLDQAALDGLGFDPLLVEAAAVVDRHTDEPTAPRPVPPRSDRVTDEDAEFARIVAAFEAEHGRNVVAAEPRDDPPPPPAERSVLDAFDDHYEPPPPPPLPVLAPASLYALLLIGLGAVLLIAPTRVGLSLDLGLVLGVAAVVGGVSVLVSRMRDRDSDDGDNGAVV